MATAVPVNPFRPGAGHMPPYLAGRARETDEFSRLLKQEVILKNLVLTGLRGVGKTVLLDTFKPLAMAAGWAWIGTDLSQASSLSEDRLAVRLMTDLAMVTSSLVVGTRPPPRIGFASENRDEPRYLDFGSMAEIYHGTPGLASDRLRAVLEFVWDRMQGVQRRGLILAYDEAQNLSDHSKQGQYPLSLMLDVFQSIQKKGIPFMLVLAGLPPLFAKLVEARTFAERMFRVVFLDRLDPQDSRDAIVKPIEATPQIHEFSKSLIQEVIDNSGGYPYFIQFICRELVDLYLQMPDEGSVPAAPWESILEKLDNDFYAGRWARTTDRERDLLAVVARLPNCESEFTVHEVVERSRGILNKPFRSSRVNQMFTKLADMGLIYKNRRGKYSFGMPLLGRFILRQQEQP